VIFNDQWTLSPKWLNQFQILIGREREETTSVSAAPKIVVQDTFTAGGGQMHLLRTENHAQGNDIASWSSGRHLVKLGVNLPDWSRRGVDDYSNFGGTFFFSSLAAYAAGQPYAFRQQQGSGHVVYWQKELGGFLQDDYKASSNLSLSLGMRYNWQNYLRDNDNFSPRLAFAYAPHNGRKTVLRGGAGIFYDRTNAGPHQRRPYCRCAEVQRRGAQKYPDHELDLPRSVSVDWSATSAAKRYRAVRAGHPRTLFGAVQHGSRGTGCQTHHYRGHIPGRGGYQELPFPRRECASAAGLSGSPGSGTRSLAADRVFGTAARQRPGHHAAR
jgi:hypothetical protein